MTRDMAKAMGQHFMDARLIETAADLGSNLFKYRNNLRPPSPAQLNTASSARNARAYRLK
jgi:hypothetical protein